MSERWEIIGAALLLAGILAAYVWRVVSCLDYGFPLAMCLFR